MSPLRDRTHAGDDLDRRLWSRLPFPFGYPDAVDKVGTIAAPLLAGFAFTLIGLTVGQRRALGEPDLALLLLVVAAIALVSAVQLNFNARRFHLSPGEYFEFKKLAEEDGIPPAQLKAMARTYLVQQRVWTRRARLAYNFGVAVLFFAVAATLIPPAGLDQMAPARALAVGLMALAGLVEAGLIARGYFELLAR